MLYVSGIIFAFQFVLFVKSISNIISYEQMDVLIAEVKNKWAYLHEKLVQIQIPQFRQFFRRRRRLNLLLQSIHSEPFEVIGGAFAYADARASCSVRKENAFTSSEELDDVLIVEIQRPVEELWYTFGGMRLREYTFAVPTYETFLASGSGSLETTFFGDVPFDRFGEVVVFFTGAVDVEDVVPNSFDIADALLGMFIASDVSSKEPSRPPPPIKE